MGYVGFANLPNQVHRKSVRKGFQFTAMVVGMCRVAYVDRVAAENAFSTSSQANLAWASRLSSTPFLTPLCTLPRSLSRLVLTDLRRLLSRALAPVRYTRFFAALFRCLSTLFPADIEENGVRLRLTVVDTPGFGDFVNNNDRYVTTFSRRAAAVSYLRSSSSVAGSLSLKTSKHGSTHIWSRRPVSIGKKFQITESMPACISSSPPVTRE